MLASLWHLPTEAHFYARFFFIKAILYKYLVWLWSFLITYKQVCLPVTDWRQTSSKLPASRLELVMGAIRTRLTEISVMKKSSILLIFKDMENLAFFKKGEEIRFWCNTVLWFLVSAAVIVRLLKRASTTQIRIIDMPRYVHQLTSTTRTSA